MRPLRSPRLEPAAKATAPARRRFLLISPSDKLGEDLRKMLPASCDLTVEAHPSKAKSFIHQNPNIPIIAEIDTMQPLPGALSLLLRSSAAKNVILVANGTEERNLSFMYERPGIMSLIPKDFPSFHYDLATTLNKRFFGTDLWGIKSYLKPGAITEKQKIYSFGGHGVVLMNLSRYLQEMKVYSAFPDRIHTIATELLMNAVLDAPQDKKTRLERRQSLHRNEPAKLGVQEKVSLEFGYDDRRFAIAASDGHGTLKMEDAMERLYRCSALGNHDMRMAENRGAGIGFYLMYTWSSQLVFNIVPGVKTEVICILPVAKREKHALPKTRSLNFFYGG